MWTSRAWGTGGIRTGESRTRWPDCVVDVAQGGQSSEWLVLAFMVGVGWSRY
jgi:hypothetical protein